jgi:N-acyl amino acid synthase of PEP-CTERM/exosortase system
MPRTKTSLIERLRQYFSTQLACTLEQNAQVYAIRYRVYCEQFGYEPATRFPTREEFDEFDAQSFHCLVVHKKSGWPAGCARLVPALGDINVDPLPIERVFHDRLDSSLIDNFDLDRNNVCEISRLAVDETFRRRAGEKITRHGAPDSALYGPRERSTFPFVCMSAFLGATALTEITGRTSVFAMMEPFLTRMLARSGIHFRRVGGDVDYHGIRAPYFITTQSALDSMTPDTRLMYRSIIADLQTEYEKAS